MLWLLLRCAGLLVAQAATSPFLTVWRTTSTDENITLPLLVSVFNVTVDWGDGSQPEMINNTAIATHKYSLPGLYDVTINGDVSGFSFGGQGDAAKLMEIVSWGDGFIVSTYINVFAGCVNLQVSAPPSTQPVFLPGATLSGMFMNSSFNSPLNWDLANVTSLFSMFRNATILNQPITFSNTLGVTTVNGMFAYAASFNQTLTMQTDSVTNMNSMFEGASSFNQPVPFNTAKVTGMTYMFYRATTFNQPINFNCSSLSNSALMFSITAAFNSAVNMINTGNVNSMSAMFSQAAAFNQPVTFNTRKVQLMTSMFSSAASFNQPINFDGSSLKDASSMFAGATVFNSVVNLTNTSATLTNVANMFQIAPAFNQPIYMQTDSVTTMTSMFASASSFNQPLSFNTANVLTMDYMFHLASAFNQPINFNTTKVTTTKYMFASASAFNSTVTFTSTPALQTTAGMFRFAAAFNQPITFSVANVNDMTEMFKSATSFNSPLLWPSTDTRNVTTMVSMFDGATSFNQPINFEVDKLITADSMLKGATSFNQPVVFQNSDSLVVTARMFSGAAAFNQTVVISTTQNINSTIDMFANALGFQQDLRSWNMSSSVTCTNFCYRCGLPNFTLCTPCTGQQTSESGMTVCHCPIGEMSISPTQCSVSPTPVPTAAPTAAPTTSTPTTSAPSTSPTIAPTTSAPSTSVPSTSPTIAPTTSAPSTSPTIAPTTSAPTTFPTTSVPTALTAAPTNPTVDPIGGGTSPAPTTRAPTTPTASPTVAPPSPAPTPFIRGGSKFCTAVQVSSNLQVECVIASIVEPLPLGPTPLTGIVSPLFNITQVAEANDTTFVFTLPIDPQLYVEMGKIARPCESQALSCEWQDPETLAFQRSGCTVSKARVDMGSGVVGTECTCTHLTVFAIVLRSEMQLAPLCQAQEVDYVLMVLYALLGVGLVAQMARVLRYHPITRRLSRTQREGAAAAQAAIVQHLLLLLVCVLRFVYLIAKPVIASLAGLVLLGLLPSAVTLSLFIHLLLTWASLQLATFEASPFARFRVPFVVMTLLVFMVVIILAIMVGVAPEVGTVRDGSYVLAALDAAVCVLVLISGLGMRKSISVVDALRATDWRVVFRCRLLVATLGLSTCLFVAACLWVAAVQSDIVTSSAGTLAATVAFYVFDWLSLGVLTWLFSFAVTEATAAHRKDRRRGRNTASSSTENSKKDEDSRTRTIELETCS